MTACAVTDLPEPDSASTARGLAGIQMKREAP
jgi:hypothetical protein